MNLKTIKRNSIVCIEPNIKHAPHSRLNAAFLCHISLKYPNHACYFYACNSHIREVLPHFTSIPLHLFFKPILVPPYNFTYIIFKDLYQLFQVISILLFHRNAAIVYLFGALPLTHIVLSLFSRFSILSSPLTIVMHGQFESLSPFSSLGRSKLYYKIACQLVSCDDKLNYFALSAGIKQRVCSLYRSPLVQKKIKVFPHPYFSESLLINPCDSLNQLTNYPESGSLAIGLLGRIDASKSLNILLDALNFIRYRQITTQLKLSFELIGQLSVKIPDDLINFFNIITHDSYLDQSDFSHSVESIDFSLFLDGFGSHSLKPSGSFFESLLYEKPVISMGSQFIQDFQRISGPTGIELENTSKLIDFLVNPLNIVSHSDYLFYVNNIRSLKENLDICKFV